MELSIHYQICRVYRSALFIARKTACCALETDCSVHSQREAAVPDDAAALPAAEAAHRCAQQPAAALQSQLQDLERSAEQLRLQVHALEQEAEHHRLQVSRPGSHVRMSFYLDVCCCCRALRALRLMYECRFIWMWGTVAVHCAKVSVLVCWCTELHVGRQLAGRDRDLRAEAQQAMASAADALRLEQEARELRTQLASEQARARSVSVVPPVVAQYLDAPAAVHLAHPETTGCAVPVAFMLCVPVQGTSGAEATYQHWGGVLQEEDTMPDCMKALESLMKYVHLHITRDAVLESDGMAYALRDSLYCDACHIQPGAWHCMLPAHDVRSCVEHLRLKSLEVQLHESQTRKQNTTTFVPAAVLTLRSTHKFLAELS